MEDNYEEAEKARRRKEQIEFRNKKRTSNLFMFFATIFEIIETFIVVAVMVIGSLIILSKIFPADSQVFSNILGVLMILLFIAGLIVGFLIYKKIIVWVIKKWKLEDKLLDDVLSHYIRPTKEETAEELKK